MDTNQEAQNQCSRYDRELNKGTNWGPDVPLGKTKGDAAGHPLGDKPRYHNPHHCAERRGGRFEVMQYLVGKDSAIAQDCKAK